ncbi:TPA: hypothetical protein DDW69_03590 [candidate division CPR2 bacterium]|uniref:UDP-N-acetylmuramoyl-tripeptide-D-alanyl-D-alanine ligase n=1 Tax=candidate division CPR2 bacterium GW2011_GWC1_41_48 TaxID=1618344 RepID=A0A0G0Z7M5_UNCC2|nr:MAG: UDP-N-acetylmuramoyl-tripeptide-D-alanyl-D-alanine ligase [candidate division CPR2 bacterium GW2011_GWC2_39_35]KKR29315.1 MAG: UDP-N-acetylmuramoyl-tripeptide-D-alanyl-D-alanine ligase [candidate division CPR2 bacterium GW2011_GWD1_39_7]KKS09028.1 MAG: UDP-N-acetylmuramoyl-tripeptide-D-alanyl-D-alanine ligase [candidate division CPR2 bacterium GW2011_GWC1_41_48]OGB62250.1 MAG: hypothetical protein A2Y27_03360 [candidate division CPR2 bacterium GWD1_39_7]HBG81898.1 hypothetical protein [
MKKAFKNLIQKILKRIAILIFTKQKPEIVGITGTIGKTSTREAVKHLLSKKYNVYAPSGSLNTEIGVPLAVIGTKSPDNILNIFSWLKIFALGLKRAYAEDYPKILILEMGVDRPHDMDWLISFVKPRISVVTAITPANLGFFNSVAEVEKEKLKILEATRELAIVNEDLVKIKKSSVPVLLYGKNGEVSFKDPKISVNGSRFKVVLGKKSAEFDTKTIANSSIYAILAAVAVGYKYDFSLEEMAVFFKDFRPYNGRMNPLKGINDSFIIDDSYNSSPESAKAALRTVQGFVGRKVLVLGGMNELGKFSKDAHQEIGALVCHVADILVTVGKDANDFMAEEALKSGLKPERLFKFKGAREAGKFLADQVKPGDIVLVKGSQDGIFLEEAVEQILKDKKDIKYLVRQSDFWHVAKDKFFRYLDEKSK